MSPALATGVRTNDDPRGDDPSVGDTRADDRSAGHSADHRWWRATWPLDRIILLRLGVSLAAVVAVWTAAGLVLTRTALFAPVVDLDQRVAEEWAAGRTETRTDLAHWGATLSDTHVKIIVTAAAVGLMLWAWRRWFEAVFVATALIFEATAFIVITFLVGRPRPDVPRLLDSPVDSSFPSGHVAAATVYGAFALVVVWHTRNRAARVAAVALTAVVAVAVGLARIYQGMHYVSDVVAGVLLGLVSLAVCRYALGRPADAEHRAAGEHDAVGATR